MIGRNRETTGSSGNGRRFRALGDLVDNGGDDRHKAHHKDTARNKLQAHHLLADTLHGRIEWLFVFLWIGLRHELSFKRND